MNSSPSSTDSDAGDISGIRETHDPEALPLDTVTYMLRADALRSRMDASGLFFAVDARLDGDRSDQTLIERRTLRLRQLLNRMLPHFRMRTHNDLEATGLASTLEHVPSREDIPHEGLRTYARIQTAQVLHMQAECRNGIAAPFTKFGWMLSQRQGEPAGGEASFDALLPPDAGIRRAYTAPGFPLNALNGKAPYLLNKSDRAQRVCVPTSAADIGTEVSKVQPGLIRIVHDTMRATAETVLRMREEIHSPETELVALPVAKALKQPMSDQRLLADLRELLRAALHRLLP